MDESYHLLRRSGHASSTLNQSTHTQTAQGHQSSQTSVPTYFESVLSFDNPLPPTPATEPSFDPQEDDSDSPTVDAYKGLTLEDLSDPLPGRAPEYPMHVLMQVAIQSSPYRRLRQCEIRDALMERFPYYVEAGKTWRNTLRHALTNRASFHKVPKPANVPGRGAYWSYKFTRESKRKTKPVSIRGTRGQKSSSRVERTDDDEERDEDWNSPEPAIQSIGGSSLSIRAQALTGLQRRPDGGRPPTAPQPQLDLTPPFQSGLPLPSSHPYPSSSQYHSHPPSSSSMFFPNHATQSRPAPPHIQPHSTSLNTGYPSQTQDLLGQPSHWSPDLGVFGMLSKHSHVEQSVLLPYQQPPLMPSPAPYPHRNSHPGFALPHDLQSSSSAVLLGMLSPYAFSPDYSTQPSLSTSGSFTSTGPETSPYHIDSSNGDAFDMSLFPPGFSNPTTEMKNWGPA